MRARNKWIFAATSAALLAALAAPWPFGSAALREQAARQLDAAAGLKVSTTGNATLSLLPTPQIKLTNVTIRDGSGTLKVTADIIKGKLRLLPLIAGRMEIEGLTLHNPLIAIDIDSVQLGSKSTSQARAGKAQPDLTASHDPDAPRLGTFTIIEGQALVRSSAATYEIAEFTGINAVLDWQNSRAPAALSGTGIWRNTLFDISALLAKPADTQRGQGSPFTLNLKSPLGRVSFDGALSTIPRWQFAGQLKASTGNATEFLEFTRADLPLPGRVEKLNIAAQTRILSNAITLSGLRLDVDRNFFEGTLAIINDEGKPNITGTLASPNLKFDPRASHLPQLTVGGEWSDSDLRTSALARLNMDIRISTASLLYGQLALANVAMSTIVKDSRMEIALSSAKGYSGALKARMSLLADQPVPNFRTLLQFDNIDSGAFLRDAASSQKLSGVATGEMELRSHGRNVREFVHNAQGSLRADLSEGALNGLDIDRALRLAQTQPLSLPADIRSGRTLYKKAQISAALDAGILNFTNVRADSDTLTIMIGGTVSLPAKSLNLDIDAKRPEISTQDLAIATQRPPLSLKLDLTGPWSNPSLQLDAESLINNSAAAAPLMRNLHKPGGQPEAPVLSKQ